MTGFIIIGVAIIIIAAIAITKSSNVNVSNLSLIETALDDDSEVELSVIDQDIGQMEFDPIEFVTVIDDDNHL